MRTYVSGRGAKCLKFSMDFYVPRPTLVSILAEQVFGAGIRCGDKQSKYDVEQHMRGVLNLWGKRDFCDRIRHCLRFNGVTGRHEGEEGSMPAENSPDVWASALQVAHDWLTERFPELNEDAP